MEDNLIAAESFISDHDYIVTQNTFEFINFTKEIIIYISGFVVHKLASTLQCETCVRALYAINKDQFLNSLIFIKHRGGFKGGLVYPSEDVIIVCLQTEKTLKYFNYQTKAINKLKIQSQVLNHFLNNSKIFNSFFFNISIHSKEINSPLSDHVPLLIKSISTTYINLKVKYSLKAHNETQSMWTWYNKLTL